MLHVLSEKLRPVTKKVMGQSNHKPTPQFKFSMDWVGGGGVVIAEKKFTGKGFTIMLQLPSEPLPDWILGLVICTIDSRLVLQLGPD